MTLCIILCVSLIVGTLVWRQPCGLTSLIDLKAISDFSGFQLFVVVVVRIDWKFFIFLHARLNTINFKLFSLVELYERLPIFLF